MKLGSYDPRDVQQESTRWLPQKIPAQRMFCASKLSCQIKRLRPNGLFTLCCESSATCDRQLRCKSLENYPIICNAT